MAVPDTFINFYQATPIREWPYGPMVLGAAVLTHCIDSRRSVKYADANETFLSSLLLLFPSLAR